MKYFRSIFVSILFTLAALAAAQYDVQFFVANAGNDVTNSGLSATDAFKTIKKAVFSVPPGEYGRIVLVDDPAGDTDGEVFSGTDNVAIPIGTRKVTIESRSGVPQNCTILGADSKYGFHFDSPANNGSIVRGITFEKMFDDQEVGGGAIRVEALGTVNIVVETCIFKDSNSGTFSSGRGGAVALFDSNSTFVNCCFRNNKANLTDGKGGAVYAVNSSPSFRGCVFVGNGTDAVSTMGGAIYGNSSDIGLENCELNGNVATSGGAVFVQIGSVSTLGSSFAGNKASGTTGGGAVALFSADILMTNCTVVGYSGNASADGAFYLGGSSGGNIFNSIVWGNGPLGGIVDDSTGSLVFSHSNVDTSVTPSDISNSQDAPMLIDMPDTYESKDFGDLRLADGSPCIDSGSTSDYLLATPTAPMDLDAIPRPLGSEVDRGAYEKVDAVFLISQIKNQIDQFVNDGTTLPANGHPLKQKLDQAAAAVVAGDIPKAILRLNEFIQKVASFTAPKKLSSDQAQQLTSLALVVIGLLQGL